MEMNIENALEIARKFGDFEDREGLGWLATAASQHRLIAEVGSCVGRTARAMADNTTGEVYCIDTWEGTASEADFMEQIRNHPPGWLRQSFDENVRGLANVHPVQASSQSAAEFLKEMCFDMIFIDADHSYESVKADILAWRPLLAEGGLLCGHDYHPSFPGVIQAVNELIPAFSVSGVIWRAL